MHAAHLEDVSASGDPTSGPAIGSGPRPDPRTRVVVADDHAGVRTALTRLLQGLEDITLVGAAVDGEHAVSLCREIEPDVVLMDLRMPVLDGVEATRRITADRPQTRIVLFTAFPSEAQIADALAAGAVACVLKHESRETILGAIRSAAGCPPLEERAP